MADPPLRPVVCHSRSPQISLKMISYSVKLLTFSLRYIHTQDTLLCRLEDVVNISPVDINIAYNHIDLSARLL